MAGVVDNFLYLPLTPPGIEVLDGGKLAPVMYWAVRTTLCSALQLEVEQLPYQVVMETVRMLSIVTAFLFLNEH